MDMIPYTDTHCHLDFDRFDMDREKVLKRAWESGLVWILNPGINLITSQKAIDLAKKYPERLNAAVGIHPNYGKDWTADHIPALCELAQNSVVVAIGEIGLDYYRQYTDFDQQRIMFKAQLKLAAQLSLPVIIHNRESTEDLMEIITNWHNGLVKNQHPLAERPGVLHSYCADIKTAQEAIAMNFYIGISGPVTFKNAPDRKSVTASLPLDHILLETDAPFLTPHPHRGKRNEPAYIPLIA
ncbi:MAG: TatD family hydrolase, partial [Chloroflexota bacterium]|nr:TatD family hydrolase [Chloroflexota bacterium]